MIAAHAVKKTASTAMRMNIVPVTITPPPSARTHPSTRSTQSSAGTGERSEYIVVDENQVCFVKRLALSDLPRGKGTTRAATVGVPLRSQTRQLAQHGRNRDRCAAQPMSGPAHRHPCATRSRDRRLGTRAQCFKCTHQMDVHNCKGSRQNGLRLSKARFRPRAPGQSVIITVQRY